MGKERWEHTEILRGATHEDFSAVGFFSHRMNMLEYLSLMTAAEKPDVPPWARKIMIEVLTKMAPYMAVEELRRVAALRATVHRVLSRSTNHGEFPTDSPSTSQH